VIGDSESADAHAHDSLDEFVADAVAGEARVLQLEMCGCGEHWLLAVPTGRRGRLEPAELGPRAWISAALPATRKPELGRAVLQGARTAVALEVMLREAGQAAHRRLGATALAEIAAGELDSEATRRRLAEFGIDREVTAIMLTSADGDPEALDCALEVMMEALASRWQASLVGRLDDRLAVLSDCSEEDAYDLAERLVSAVSLAAGVTGQVAVSGAQPSSDAYRALYEAETICRTHAARGCSGSIGTSRDLNSADQLLLHQSPETLRRFCEAVLGELRGVEAPYARELLRTLRIFLCEHGHWERTSRRLPCHRGTLRYRARKIEVMTGRDLTSASDRVELWLALRASELLGESDLGDLVGGESDLGDLVGGDPELADPAN
jgi:purine catabolism regulator